ncbi:MAG TPA: P-II family nitrogen regulator [Candidatus Nitrosotalea sp.]|nr:P-II family nitrogen regulator [Candidatus Nitrosotalea sp.]
MKRVEAVVSNEKLDAVVEALKKVGVGGITVFEAKGWGRASKLAKGAEKSPSSVKKYNVKSYILTVVDDSIVDKVISAIIETASTGSVGDGKIFIDNIDTAVDIGSGQKGVHAI